MQTGDQALLDQIDEYNREDCIATRLLRDWLLELRARGARRVRPVPAAGAGEPKPVPEAKEERAELRERAARGGRGAGGAAARLPRPRAQAGLVGVSSTGSSMTPEELLEDAEAIGGLEHDGEPVRVEAVPGRYTLTFPPQEHKLGVGQQTADRATRRSRRARSPSSTASAPARAQARPRRSRTCRCRRRSIPGDPYSTPEQEAALERFGRSLLAGDRRYPALESILRREPFDRPVQTSDLDEMKELVLGLDGRHLVIQGPPGSGKTWTSGRLIAHLLANGQDGRRRLDEPQGDPQPARRRRRGGRRARDLVRRAQEGERRQPGVVLRRARDRGRRSTRTRPSAPTSPPARRGSSRARTRRSTTSSSTRPGRCRSPTRSRWGRRRGTSSSSATRSSSTR